MSGNAAIDICGSWDATNMQANNPDLKIDAFILPSNDGSKGLMGSIASGFSLNAETENRDAAIAFLNYCASGWTEPIDRAHGGISADESIESSNNEKDRNRQKTIYLQAGKWLWLPQYFLPAVSYLLSE